MGASADAYVLHHDTPFGATLALVADELDSAMVRFESFNSPHEGYAVIREELERELWEHVCQNTGRSDDARDEAIQVAAMALRYVIDLCGSSTTPTFGRLPSIEEAAISPSRPVSTDEEEGQRIEVGDGRAVSVEAVLRAALAECEAVLYTLRRRAEIRNWDSTAMPSRQYVDGVISKARNALGSYGGDS